MFRIPGVDKRKIAVFGLGATGLAACEALVASGADVFSWDESKSARAKTANTKYRASQPKDWPWDELASVVLSPGVPLTHPQPHVIVRKAAVDGVEVIGDIELFARAIAALPADERPRVIAVTGSNGKSTTTSLIGHVLAEAGRAVHVGGNIGVPLLALPTPSPRAVYVLELSSFQLDLTTSFRADTAILLNITPDHLDRHGTMDNYIASKKRIFDNRDASAPGLSVIGVDDPYCQGICAALSADQNEDVAPISAAGALGKGVFVLDGKLYYRLDNKTGEAGDISQIDTLRGRHNAQNAAAALAAVMAEGVAPPVAIRSMERFRGLKHRAEPVGRRAAVSFVNDSKATNPAAAATALSAYDNIYWIAGGKPKGEGEDGIEDLVGALANVRKAFLIGQSAATLSRLLSPHVACVECLDLADAVAKAGKAALASGYDPATVLLSPAYASQDQFKNFEDRGDAFRALVAELLAASDDENGAAA